MTTRQRPASDSAAVVVPAESSSANGISNGDTPIFRWEAWFAGASADQRADALRLARQQGVLYFQQLPALGNRSQQGAGKPTLAPLLARLLAGKAEALASLGEEPLAWADTQLDPLQREAVRRALNTPDVALLQGLPGTGKSQVVTEVITQAARRGWRVLLVAPGTPAIDVVLARLAGCPEVLPVRLLAPDERAEALPVWLRALTLAEQRRAFRERALAGARQARAQAEETCQRRQREEAVWPQLGPMTERFAALDARLQNLAHQRAELQGQIEREAAGVPFGSKGIASGPFAAALIEQHARSTAALAGWEATQKTLETKLNAARDEQGAIAAQLAVLESRCRARQEGRWWSISYWTGGSAVRLRDGYTARLIQVEATLHELEQAAASQVAARLQLDDQAEAECQELIGGETQRRQQELTAAATAVRAERDQLECAWHSLVDPIQPIELHPAGRGPADLDAACMRWQERRRLDELGCQFARQWADYLDEAGEQLLPRLPALANLLAVPTAALAQGREWAEAAETPFDLLIVEDADRLAESELLRLAVHAPRLLLVSQAGAEVPPAPPPGRGPRSPQGLAPLAVCWPRLWQALGDDLGRLPYVWRRDGDHLVCQLAAVRPDDERYLESEGLADAPEIVLQILNLPRARPMLARVRFPGHFTIPQATAFIYRELQELPIEPLGRTAWWQETADAWVLHLGPTPIGVTDLVDLGAGVRMALVGAGAAYAGRAARLEFARAAGWDRAGALRWLTTHLQWRDRDRAVFLQVPYRMERQLAEVIGPLLFADSCLAQLLSARPATGALFEFVPVPAPRKSEWPREGAGLEHDLATGRHSDRLPSELRGELPRKGIVNYLEAQALVRRLEQWAQAPAELVSNGKGAPTVLVLALYEAQAELLRCLAARSAILRGRRFDLEIAVPGQARHRECDVLVLSLTRSHAHRCVPFGDDTADLALALTRARQRLLVFGDLGTLVRRTNWQGPLDHLGAPEAQLEGLRVSRLLRHLQSMPTLCPATAGAVGPAR